MHYEFWQGFLALGCICTFYLNFIFDIFENIKIFQMKMLCVHLHVLRVHKIALRKCLLYGVCKK
jgi:hypothetical protein